MLLDSSRDCTRALSGVFTCLPVKPWQMTRVSLSIHTLAFADMKRRPWLACATKMRDADASVVMVEEDVGFCERTLNADGQDYYVEFYVRRKRQDRRDLLPAYHSLPISLHITLPLTCLKQYSMIE